MTPRTYWDRDGYLWQEAKLGPGWLQVIWSPNSQSWCQFTAVDPQWLVEKLYGPLIGTA